jgi:hypothetical protein
MSEKHDEWTTDERRALEALPRERIPDPALEQRVVQALHGAGLLRSQRRASRALWAGAAAAAVALFSSGLALGQWLGARSTTEAVRTAQRGDQATAALIRQTGAAYVSALALLSESSGVAAGAEQERSRRAAVQVLRAAAAEILQLSPNEPLAARILQGLESSRPGEAASTAGAEVRRVVWF